MGVGVAMGVGWGLPPPPPCCVGWGWGGVGGIGWGGEETERNEEDAGERHDTEEHIGNTSETQQNQVK